MQTMKRALLISALCISLVVAPLLLVCTMRTLLLFGRPSAPKYAGVPKNWRRPNFNEMQAVTKLAQALTYATVSGHAVDFSVFEDFIGFIEKSFPIVHSSSLVNKERIANYSLLYTITGRNSTLKPYMLCSHIDVVPVERQAWKTDPFSGLVKDGYIHGRGAIDTKGTLIGSLEAMEILLTSGFRPERTILLAYGHEEEIGGGQGAPTIAKVLKTRYQALEYVLDEGLAITKGIAPGISIPAALIGVAEKIHLVVKLEANVSSSENALHELVRATSRFHSNIHPSQFGFGVERDLIEGLGPYASPFYKFIFSNLWIFGGLFVKIAEKKGETNALMRTTTAVTVINGGTYEKFDQPPLYAYAIVDHRVHPSQSVEDVLRIDRELIKDTKVTIRTLSSIQRVHISKYGPDILGYSLIKQTIQQLIPEAVIAPGLVIGATDSRFYTELSDCVYKFSPLILEKSDLPMIHGHNEKISVTNFLQIIHFYHNLILNSDEGYTAIKS